MHPYLVLVAASCLVCALCAGCLFANQPSRRPNQLAALLLVGVSFWAMCEVFWNLADDAASALWRVRLASLGWIFIGPIFLHLTIESIRPPKPLLRHILWAQYAVSGLFFSLSLTTPLITASVMPTSWGWAYEPGSLFPIAYASVIGSVGIAIYLVLRDFHRYRSPAEKRQGPWIVVGVALPVFVSTATDVVLPVLGVPFPGFGTTSFAIMGVLAVWTMFRFGYSFMVPGTFAHEILATLPDGVALVQRDQRISTANPSLAKLTGYSSNQLSGMAVCELLYADAEATDPDNDESGTLLLRAANGPCECELICESGDRIPVAISAAVLRDPQQFSIGIVLVIRDQRVVADLRNRLVTSARLAAVGELAAGIAHEINNPIAFVRANLSQLQRHWKTIRAEFSAVSHSDEVKELFCEGEEMIEESLEGVNRAAEIVRGVQGYSHAGHGEREPADLNLLIENVLQMAAIQLRDRATVERYYDDLPLLQCAPQELKQVFLNLIVNSAHAVGDGGVIRIHTSARGGAVEVQVDDNGCGIEPDLIGRIFDPFFTTKRVGDGTGLGLGIAYQIVRRHGGEITATSTPGEGSSFRVVLPLGS